MELDDELCLCFHVTQRKVINYLRIERPRRVGQLSECFGAGTGCGWCRPFLQRLFDNFQAGKPEVAMPDSAAYSQERAAYIQAGKGTPPRSASAPSE